MGQTVKAPADESTAASSRLLEVVAALAQEMRPGRVAPEAVGLDSSLDRDLGLDSLARVELVLRIERTFRVSLSEQALATVETPRDLLRAVLGAAGRIAVPMPAVREAGLALGVVAAPIGAETLIEVLEWHVRRHGDRPHIRFHADQGDGETLSFGELRARAEMIAAGLQGRDVQAGESVSIMLPTGLDYFACFLGTVLAGAVPVPLYPPGRPSQIEEHLRRHAAIGANSHSRIMITVPEAVRFGQLLRSNVETLRAVVTPGEIAADARAFVPTVRMGADTAFLQYTSGSTGTPKGVVLSHANLLANIRAMGAALRVSSADVLVSWLPLYHDMGLIGAWLGSLYYGIPLVIMSPLAFLSRPRRWLWAIHRHRGTISAAPNFAYDLCLKRIDDDELEGLDLSSWRVAANGAEPVSPETMLGFCDRFARYGFRPEAMMPMYGLAECSVGLAFPPLGRAPKVDRVKREAFRAKAIAEPAGEAEAHPLRFVACGMPLPGHEIRIVAALGRELPERHEGRLQFRGPSATSGYFRNPEASRRLFDGDWLDSGDLGYIAAGEVYLTGRAKDLIIRAGRNIYPTEIEDAVGEIPGIRKGGVAVFGTPDPRSGTERLVILAETRERDSAQLAELRSRINALTVDLVELPPDDIVFAPPNTVPKTSSGKLRRAACRELYEQGRAGKRRAAVWWQIVRFSLGGVGPLVRRWLRLGGEFSFGVYAWLVLAVVAGVTWPLVVVLPRRSWAWSAMRLGARALRFATATPLAVEGLDNLPPAGRACVLVSNHASYLDSAVLAAALPQVYGFVAKTELDQQILTRLFLRRIEAEFVERFEKEASVADMRRLVERARRGISLLFFAEGTFVRWPGLLPFYMGAFMVAAETGVPVVPIAIRGTRSMLRSGTALPRRGAITLVVEKPIDPPRLVAGDQAGVWEAAVRLRQATRAAILRHCGEPDLEHEVSPLRTATAGG